MDWGRLAYDLSEGEANFIEVFHSPADMRGLQKLADKYLTEAMFDS